MKDTRFIRMITLQGAIKASELYRFMSPENIPPQIKERLKEQLESKLSKPSVRSYFSFLIYNYVLSCAKQEKIIIDNTPQCIYDLKLPFLMETTISSMYLDNQVFDKKNGVTSKKEIQVNKQMAELLHKLTSLYISVRLKSNLSKGNKINDYLSQMFEAVNIAQQNRHNIIYTDNNLALGADKNPLTPFHSIAIINDLKTQLPQYGSVIDEYFNRCHGFSAAMFKLMAELIMDLLKYKGKEYDNIIRFAEHYGILLQLNNDICDFIYDKGTNHKKAEDVLSDLKNKTITLPMILHFAKGSVNGEVNNILNAKTLEEIKTLTKGRHNHVFKELIRSQALPRAVDIERIMAKEAMLFIQKDLAHKDLIGIFDVAWKNRYFIHIENAVAFYKGNPNGLYRCEDHQS